MQFLFLIGEFLQIFSETTWQEGTLYDFPFHPDWTCMGGPLQYLFS